MRMRLAIFMLLMMISRTTLFAEVSIEIDLAKQKAYLMDDGEVIDVSPISSGRYGHLTPRGDFEVLEKDLNHRSSLYGKIVTRSGRVLISDADSDMSVPSGARFVQAPMKYFMRFSGATGMHAGYLPGYPASHGCVRLPLENAIRFFESAEIGTPVRVHGTTPTSRPRRISRPKSSPTPSPAPVPRKPWKFFKIFGH